MAAEVKESKNKSINISVFVVGHFDHQFEVSKQ
jgi:hypothetical protein